MAKARRSLDGRGRRRGHPQPGGVTPEQTVTAREEAQRRINRREARAADLSRLTALEEQIDQIDRMLIAGLAIADNELRAGRELLLEASVQTRIKINGTSTMAFGGPDHEVRARDGEGILETTRRVLADRGATSYQIADKCKNSALRKRMDRWRDEHRGELKAFRDQLRAQPFPWARTHELLARVEDLLERIG